MLYGDCLYKKMTKKEIKIEGIEGCFILLLIAGVIYGLMMWWYIILPIIVVILGIIAGVYKSKKNKDKPKHDNLLFKPKVEKQDIIKDIIKREQKEWQEWKQKDGTPKYKKCKWHIYHTCLVSDAFSCRYCPEYQPLYDECPNCKEELESPYECNLCGWKGETCVHEDGKVRLVENCIRCSQSKSKKEDEQRSRRIPQHVKREVWRRDKGKCVECGSKGRLAYDHIIPFSKGGSNTA